MYYKSDNRKKAVYIQESKMLRSFSRNTKAKLWKTPSCFWLLSIQRGKVFNQQLKTCPGSHRMNTNQTWLVMLFECVFTKWSMIQKSRLGGTNSVQSSPVQSSPDQFSSTQISSVVSSIQFSPVPSSPGQSSLVQFSSVWSRRA